MKIIERENDMQIIVNGKTIDMSNLPSYSSISINYDGIIIDGKNVTDSFDNGNFGHSINISIQGDVQNLKASGSVSVEGNVKDIDCGGSCTVSGEVKGDIDAGGSVHCKDVYGDINAGGSVSCNNRKERDSDRNRDFF